MAKRGRPRKIKVDSINNSESNSIQNGLMDAVMGVGYQVPPGREQISSIDTVNKNLRWYLISNYRQTLSEAYTEWGVIQTIVDVPVDDALRGGYEIKTDQLSPDELDRLHSRIDRENLNDRVFGQAMKWNRLFGGAGILIITDENYEEPFDVKNLKQGARVEFRSVDLWELFFDKINIEDGPYATGSQTLENVEIFNYYGRRVHKSRVILFRGIQPPSFTRPRLRGWGLSIVEVFIRSINQYLKANDLCFEVLDEFKLDVFKIKGLTQTLLTANGTNKVQQRIQTANIQKNYLNSIAMDSEDDYQTKQLSFSGLSEVMKEIRLQIACDLRMPMTKLFGISSSGFSSGEEDIENYCSMVENSVRHKIKYAIIQVIEILCQAEFGHIPDDLKIEFPPLRMLSAEQQESVKNSKMNRIIQAMQSGLMSAIEAKQAINRENLIPIKIEETDELNSAISDGEVT